MQMNLTSEMQVMGIQWLSVYGAAETLVALNSSCLSRDVGGRYERNRLLFYGVRTGCSAWRFLKSLLPCPPLPKGSAHPAPQRCQAAEISSPWTGPSALKAQDKAGKGHPQSDGETETAHGRYLRLGWKSQHPWGCGRAEVESNLLD